MENRIIFKDKEIESIDDNVLGVSGENKQQILVFKIEEEFLNGKAYLEILLPNSNDCCRKKYSIELEKDTENECYKLEVKRSLLKYDGTVKMQLKIIENSVEIYKTKIFEMFVLEAINAVESIEEDYGDLVSRLEIKVNDLEDGFEQLADKVNKTAEDIESVKSDIEDIESLKNDVETNTENMQEANKNISDLKEKLDNLDTYDDTEVKSLIADLEKDKADKSAVNKIDNRVEALEKLVENLTTMTITFNSNFENTTLKIKEDEISSAVFQIKHDFVTVYKHVGWCFDDETTIYSNVEIIEQIKNRWQGGKVLTVNAKYEVISDDTMLDVTVINEKFEVLQVLQVAKDATAVISVDEQNEAGEDFSYMEFNEDSKSRIFASSFEWSKVNSNIIVKVVYGESIKYTPLLYVTHTFQIDASTKKHQIKFINKHAVANNVENTYQVLEFGALATTDKNKIETLDFENLDSADLYKKLYVRNSNSVVLNLPIDLDEILSDESVTNMYALYYVATVGGEEVEKTYWKTDIYTVKDLKRQYEVWKSANEKVVDEPTMELNPVFSYNDGGKPNVNFVGSFYFPTNTDWQVLEYAILYEMSDAQGKFTLVMNPDDERFNPSTDFVKNTNRTTIYTDGASRIDEISFNKNPVSCFTQSKIGLMKAMLYVKASKEEEIRTWSVTRIVSVKKEFLASSVGKEWITKTFSGDANSDLYGVNWLQTEACKWWVENTEDGANWWADNNGFSDVIVSSVEEITKEEV